MTDKEAFAKWLEEPMFGSGYNSRTRKDFVESRNGNLDDLFWAFCSGYMRGKHSQEGKEGE